MLLRAYTFASATHSCICLRLNSSNVNLYHAISDWSVCALCRLPVANICCIFRDMGITEMTVMVTGSHTRIIWQSLIAICPLAGKKSLLYVHSFLPRDAL